MEKKICLPKKFVIFCIKYNIKLIYLSSMQVYKNYGIENISKNSNINLNNPYSKAHYSSEKLSIQNSLNYKNMYTILRMGNVFGLKNITILNLLKII